MVVVEWWQDFLDGTQCSGQFLDKLAWLFFFKQKRKQKNMNYLWWGLPLWMKLKGVDIGRGQGGKKTRQVFMMSLLNYPFCKINCILLPKLFWPTVRKKCSRDREKLLKLGVEGREFPDLLRSLEKFIQTVKGRNKFW